ncbi:S1 RNA-binding domain-containing protein [Streptococcus pneumoniae]|nr:S1 RNA-binding domain-containing protein [Streptococcus pneumoniae]VOH75950.1 S1 RNA-binding domain-containing protein [Streptococcus pneumoniae]
MILFENLFKPGQLHLAVDMLLTSSVLSATSKQCFELTSSVLSATSKQCFELTSSVLSATSKQCFELTSSVLSTTSKQCFEQPVTSFLSDALVLIAYNQKEKFSPEKHIE